MTKPSPSASLTLRLHERLKDIPEKDWDNCVAPEAQNGRADDPFTTYRFLSALEDSGAVCPQTGWQPLHISARNAAGILVGAAPLYLKYHSQGEYIFDHEWAGALENAGGRYYPKLQIAVPFTPVTGRRLLTRHPNDRPTQKALLETAIGIAKKNHLSSLHITFCTEKERALAEAHPALLARTSQQFHWTNQGYAGFDDFLSTLTSRKRKNIRKERKSASDFGGKIETLVGDDIKPHHWDAFWAFYQDTSARKWGQAYLTRAFFDLAHERLRDDIVLMLAHFDGAYVAGALHFLGRRCLFGRYWGRNQDYAFLHFEMCYYRAIDYAITHGLERVEAGAQGMHKLARGYHPCQTHSLHWIGNPSFREAVKHYLQSEHDAICHHNAHLETHLPYRRQSQENE